METFWMFWLCYRSTIHPSIQTTIHRCCVTSSHILSYSQHPNNKVAATGDKQITKHRHRYNKYNKFSTNHFSHSSISWLDQNSKYIESLPMRFIFSHIKYILNDGIFFAQFFLQISFFRYILLRSLLTRNHNLPS